MLSREEINARSIRLHPDRVVDRYTGTLNNPHQQAQANYMGPRWNNFFGELEKSQEDAQDAGKSFRVGLGGFGNGYSQQESDMPTRRSGTALTDDERAGVLGNVALGDLVDRNRARLIQDQMLRQGQTQDAVEGMKQGYDEQVNASLFAPPPEPHVLTHTPAAPGQSDRFSLRPDATAPLVDAREAVLKQIQRLPANHPARMEIEKRLAAQDAATAADKMKAATLTETQRHNLAQEQAAKDALAGKTKGRGVTAGNAEELADYDTSVDELGAVRAAISPKDSTGIVARIGATIPFVTQITGWGEDAKKRQAVIDRVKQVIGKTLEGGVLRKEDEAKYEKILPTIGDAPGVAQEKLNGLETAIKKRKDRRLDALEDSGFEVGDFRQRASGAGTVMLKAPDGSTRAVPADQAEHYIGLGAKRVQ